MPGDRFSLSLTSLGPLKAGRKLLDYAGTFLGNAFIYPISRLVPRDAGQLVFGAPSGRFEGNAKYLFLWMSTKGRSGRPTWITDNAELVATLRSRGFRAFRRWSVRGMWNAARAGVFVVNDNSSDINFSLSGGAKVFNLWHGVGLKNVNRGARVGYGAQLKYESRNPISRIRNMRRFQKPTWVLATSEQTAIHFFARCFELSPSQAPALGYPRLDPLINAELRELGMSFEDVHGLDDRRSFRRSLLYVPTLRVRDDNLLVNAIPDVSRLSAALKTQDAILYLKLHPKTQIQTGWATALPRNIRLLPDDLDIYPLLDSFDGIVTDFSSLFFDYIALRPKGVTLYPFDYEKYVAQDRDLAWNYDDVSIGVRVDSFEGLCGAIEEGSVFASLDPGKLNALRDRFWGGELGTQTACERIEAYLADVRG